ncbi:hypothetical protein [Salinibacillus aidingensis]|uniref:hypothetical protein n=1 Tax=Salinibacillus aidingensis TaxID=237684 RepID=UPI0031D75D57
MKHWVKVPLPYELMMIRNENTKKFFQEVKCWLPKAFPDCELMLIHQSFAYCRECSKSKIEKELTSIGSTTESRD